MKNKPISGREVIRRIKPLLSSASIGEITVEIGVNEAVWLNVKVRASEEILSAMAGATDLNAIIKEE